MAFTNPTVSEFKTYFNRDFPYGTTLQTVQDNDVTKAISQASFNINQALFGTQDAYAMAFMYLTAHYLVMDLRMASQGIAGGYNWLTTNKSVGSVSEGFTVPQKILDNPYLAMLSKTGYGAKYISLLLPLLAGNIFSSAGETHA